MDQRQKDRASAGSSREPPKSGPWTFSRIEIASLRPREWPVATIELIHEKLGSVLEIATGAGCLDAACNAIAQLFGVIAPIRSLDIHYEASPGLSDGLPVVVATVEVAVDGAILHGSTGSGDLLVSAIGAYLDALSRAFDREFRLSRERH